MDKQEQANSLTYNTSHSIFVPNFKILSAVVPGKKSIQTDTHTRKRQKLQSTLVTSNSLISNNRLSRSENLVPVLTLRSTNRQQNIVKKRRNYFQYISNLGVKLKIHSVKGGCSINCFPQFRKSDMSK